MVNPVATSVSSISCSGDSVSYDIAIVGGGMVGAALALICHHQNPDWQIVMVEAFPLPAKDESFQFQPSYDDRSTALSAGSADILDKAGIWQSLLAQSTSIRQIHVSDKGHFGGTLINSEDYDLEALGRVVPNAWIGTSLLANIRSIDAITLWDSTKVSQVRPVTGGARFLVNHNEDEKSVFARVTVIADGAGSKQGTALGIDSTVQDYNQYVTVANVTLDRCHDGIAYERFTDQGPMAFLPLGGESGQTMSLVWTHPAAEHEQLCQLSDDKFISRLQSRFGRRAGRVTQVGKRDYYPLKLMVANEQVRSSVVLMGNAAHFLHPVAGQGFNLALRDCQCLAETLAEAERNGEAIGSIQVLERYLAQQWSDQKTTIRFSDSLVKLFSSNQLSLAALRGLGFFGLEMLPPTKSLLARQSMGYR